MLDKKDMRVVYNETLMEMAAGNPSIAVLEADLMKATGTTEFFKRFPDRAFNVGIAEANLISVAAGLSNEGFIPFANTLSPFAARRCYDQVYLSAAYAALNVKIGGMDPGIFAESNGGSHTTFEDIALMSAVPTMTVVEPTDEVCFRSLLPQIASHYGPVYFRFARRAQEKIYEDGKQLVLGKAETLLQGDDATVIACGMMVKTALDAAELLREEGLSVGVIDMHTIKPLDEAAVLEAAKRTGAVVTAENHNIINGLGCAVAACLSETMPVPVVRVGVQDRFGQVGKLDFLKEEYGLTPQTIAAAVKKAISLKK